MRKILSKILDNPLAQGGIPAAEDCGRSIYTADEYFALSLSGWVFPVFAWAGIYFLINILFGRIVANIISIIIFVIPFLLIKIKKIPLTVFTLSSFLLFSLFLRLAFLEQAIFPAYFDSAEHYRVIQYFLNIYQSQSSPTNWFLPNYYHAGYHFISAALIQIFQFNEINFMLVFGQVVLTVLPISFFFLLKQITQSNTVAFFTCLIAAFGFHMPAHLINWGKYPALLSLVGIQFVFCLGYILVKQNSIHKPKLYWLMGFSVFITALIHTRTLIVFILFVISFFITSQVKKLSTRFQYFSFIFIFIVLGVEVFYIYQSPALFPLVTGYTQRDLWMLIFFLFLIFFSIKSFSQITFFLFATICLFLAALFLPISLFNYGTQTLLDRPFVQMLVYFPLSIIAGLGFAGLISTVQKNPYTKLLITLVLFSFVLFNLNFNYKFYPSDCCLLVSPDDLSAMTWIKQNIQQDEKILIAATQIYVTSYEPPGPAAVDAGIWIQPLTNRITEFAFISTNFESQETLTYVCEKKIKYIYIGSTSQSFDEIQLASQPHWYQPVFLLPQTKIYQVIGCQ